VLLNIGNGFNASTGEFTSPYNATYFFLASSEDPSFSRVMDIALVVDNTELDQVYSDTQPFWIPVSILGVAKMKQGQKAWVKVRGSNIFFNWNKTAFSGFLISHTP
jgi:hypothetical protein